MWRKVELPDPPAESEIDPLAGLYEQAERNRKTRARKTMREELREAIVPLALIAVFAVALGTAIWKDKRALLEELEPEVTAGSDRAVAATPGHGGAVTLPAQRSARPPSAQPSRSAGHEGPAPDATPPASGSTAGGRPAKPPIDVLRRLVELARSGSFYLLLDPAARTLTLNHRGVVARTWTIERIEMGTPRVLFVARRAPVDLAGTTWTNGRLDPPRAQQRPLLEVDSQGTPQGPEPELIPPTPEEAVPAPGRYRIRFDGGLTVEVVAAVPDLAESGDATPAGSGTEAGRIGSSLGGWKSAVDHRWVDAEEAIALNPGSSSRLKLVLPAAEAAGLYRGFPLGADLLVPGA
jgi:hypothetical protein